MFLVGLAVGLVIGVLAGISGVILVCAGVARWENRSVDRTPLVQDGNVWYQISGVGAVNKGTGEFIPLRSASTLQTSSQTPFRPAESSP